jgi:Cu/Ag efflux protein CusF
MRTLLIGVAAAGLVGATSARAEEQRATSDQPAAQTSQSQSSQTQSPSGRSSMDQTPSSQSSTSQASSGATGTSASGASTELSGVVKGVDKDKHSLKISSTSGGEQELKLADSATITRDGTQAGLDQIKEGDQVRASFDASGKQASSIEVTSKQKMGDKDKSETKTQSKDKY